MGNALHPNERTLIYMLRKISVALGKTIVSLILIALLAIFVTSVSPVYAEFNLQMQQNSD